MLALSRAAPWDPPMAAQGRRRPRKAEPQISTDWTQVGANPWFPLLRFFCGRLRFPWPGAANLMSGA
jgi:hypothetical protein